MSTIYSTATEMGKDSKGWPDWHTAKEEMKWLHVELPVHFCRLHTLAYTHTNSIRSILVRCRWLLWKALRAALHLLVFTGKRFVCMFNDLMQVSSPGEVHWPNDEKVKCALRAQKIIFSRFLMRLCSISCGTLFFLPGELFFRGKWSICYLNELWKNRH